jgi:hypothetical protein
MSDDVQIPDTTDALDEAGGRALVEAWRASGLSGAAFCRAQNLRAQRLHYWRERLGYPIKVVGGARSSMAHSCPSSAPASSEGFVQVVVGPSPSVLSTYVDIVVGDAVVRVRSGFDVVLLRAVVRALSAEPGC